MYQFNSNYLNMSKSVRKFRFKIYICISTWIHLPIKCLEVSFYFYPVALKPMLWVSCCSRHNMFLMFLWLSRKYKSIHTTSWLQRTMRWYLHYKYSIHATLSYVGIISTRTALPVKWLLIYCYVINILLIYYYLLICSQA